MTTTTTQNKVLYPLDLTPGDTFALSLRKNAKTYTVAPNAAIEPVLKICKENKFKISEGYPDWGKVLIICAGCGQLILSEDQEVFILKPLAKKEGQVKYAALPLSEEIQIIQRECLNQFDTIDELPY